MNSPRNRRSSWSACSIRCMLLGAAWLALLAGEVGADEVAAKPFLRQPARTEASRVKSHRLVGAWSATPTLRHPGMRPDLVSMQWQAENSTVLHQPADEQYIAAASGFGSRSLFRTRKEQKYRDTLGLLLSKRQLRVWLRDDLLVQCELKRYRSADAGRELGFKVGVSYRFE